MKIMATKVETIAPSSGSQTGVRTEEEMKGLHPSKARKLLLGFTCGVSTISTFFHQIVGTTYTENSRLFFPVLTE